VDTPSTKTLLRRPRILVPDRVPAMTEDLFKYLVTVGRTEDHISSACDAHADAVADNPPVC
jgi:hypothetical protein